MNPVVLLDEVDKLGNDWRGDPSSALLEVLDPAQNHTFRDHYLELDLDLSDVLFLTTANVLDTIPGPLLDRMEIVQLDGYTEDEKVAIATHHLFPRQRRTQRPDRRRRARSPTTRCTRRRRPTGRGRPASATSSAARQAVRKTAARIASGTATPPITIDVDDVQPALGRAKFHSETAERTGVPGLATGLAVTGVGGDVLSIEVTAMDGEPGLHVTGQLGDVMSESAQIALSFVRAHASELGIDPASAFERPAFHLHVPVGRRSPRTVRRPASR